MDRRPDGGGERVEIIWDDPAFELPLPIRVGSEDLRLDMPGGRGTILVETGTEVEVDPDGRVLSEPPKR